MMPFFSRVGGKSKNASHLIDLFPTHTTYVEPFCGSSAILFRKPISSVEVINDNDTDIINMYKDLLIVPNDVYQAYDFKVNSKERFNELLNKKNIDCPIERLHRNMSLSIASFGCNRITYAPCRSLYNGVLVKKNIQKYKNRLSNVIIHNEDYKNIILKYDSPTTLFFLDPPYENSDKRLYMTHIMDFKSMADLLKNIKGRFFMTINESPLIRELFKDFNIYERNLFYIIGNHAKRKNVIELIITNYPCIMDTSSSSSSSS